MDPSFLCLDEQTVQPATLTNRQTWDLRSLSPSKSSDGNMLPSCATGAEFASEAVDMSAKTNRSKSHSLEQTTDLYDVKPLVTSCNLPKRAPTDCDYLTSHYCGFSEQVSPALSRPSQQDHFCPSVFESKEKDQKLLFAFTQENNTQQQHGLTSSASEDLLEPSVSQPPLSCDHSQATSQLRSPSYHTDSLEGEMNTALVPDLYIFESEPLNFILSSHVDPGKITCPEYQPFSQLRGEEADPECDPHNVMCDSENVVSQCRLGSSHLHTMLDCDSEVSQQRKQRSSSEKSCVEGMMSGSDVGQRTAEVSAASRPNLPHSNSPVELWLDACQYFAVEDVEDRDATDNMGLSVTQGPPAQICDLPFPAREKQVSGYNGNGYEGIGWSDSDALAWGPPVERWSSVDSWSSALSDWSGIFTALPEDLTAAFTEIGAEIDALRQALAEVNTQKDTDASQEPQEVTHAQQPMGVQDQPLKTQNLPETSILSGQSCLPLCKEPSGQDLQDENDSSSTSSLCAISLTIPQEIQSNQSELPKCPTVSVSPTVASLDHAAPESTFASDTDLFNFERKVESDELDNFITVNEDPIILRIIEDTDICDPSRKLTLEPLADGRCEVTDEDRKPVAQPGSLDEQEAQSCIAGNDWKVPDLPFHNTWTSPTSHVSAVDIQPDLKINVLTHVSCDASPDVERVHQLEPQRDGPKFITPIAQLGSSASWVFQKDIATSKDRDLQCDHLQPCIPDPISDRIACSFLDCATIIPNKDNCTDIAAIPSLEKHQELDPANIVFTERRAVTENIDQLSKELSNLAFVPADHFVISEEKNIAVFTLDLNDPFAPRKAKQTTTAVKTKGAEKMPHKSHKSASENKPRSKKDKCGGHHCATQALKKQDNISNSVLASRPLDTHPIDALNNANEETKSGFEDKEVKPLETTVATEKASSKSHGKKKKKHAQSATGVAITEEPLGVSDTGTKPQSTKGRVEMFEAKPGPQTGKVHKDDSRHPEVRVPKGEQPHHSAYKDHQPKLVTRPSNDDVKRRRLSENKFGKIVGMLESKLPKQEVSRQAKGEDSKVAVAPPKKAYSEVVKQKIPAKEEPKVVKSITAQAVSGDPQSLCLWCQFTAVSVNHTITWSRDGTVLSELKRSAGDESRASLTISKASHKDLGKYQCRLASLHGTVVLDYLLTYEVLGEIVIPSSPTNITSNAVEVDTEEEDVQCSRLMFKEDFLSEQYFGENQPVSIITEKVHFGEGMHRRAFRTRLHTGHTPLSLDGESCVLKVHNSISYGTKSNEELIQKNFNLAVEECQVQNTAREYIKAYTTAAQSIESFGAIPEIIPIYLVHRPSNDIPYATLEEELIGDFVKYSVKDGKEINLMRRDSEAGQKCCAFQHWVYHKTEGNLLVTDMQGVGMKLTDVGIATSKKGYKGFKGNCATSFIDQFKALHQCNKYCEILGLSSLQPKTKKPTSTLKPKAQHPAAAKKKTFGPTVKGKS